MENLDRQSIVQTVTRAWSEVFAVDDLTEESDFFSLGGDSILLTIVALQIEEALGIMIQPELIYDAPTISEFSEAIARSVQSA